LTIFIYSQVVSACHCSFYRVINLKHIKITTITIIEMIRINVTRRSAIAERARLALRSVMLVDRLTLTVRNPSVVSVALSCTTFEIIDVDEHRDLEI